MARPSGAALVPARTPVPAPAARSAAEVARGLPRAASLAPTPGDEPVAGRVVVADSVVEKIAARAAVEVDDVGGTPGLVGRLGGRSASLGSLPTVSATVDGALAFLEVSMSVRYPASVRRTAAAVREQVRTRVGELAGLDVQEVDISVPALVTDLPTPRRVR